eukprot:6232900-Amphidinium_carterae.1
MASLRSQGGAVLERVRALALGAHVAPIGTTLSFNLALFAIVCKADARPARQSSDALEVRGKLLLRSLTPGRLLSVLLLLLLNVVVPDRWRSATRWVVTRCGGGARPSKNALENLCHAIVLEGILQCNSRWELAVVNCQASSSVITDDAPDLLVSTLELLMRNGRVTLIWLEAFLRSALRKIRTSSW